MTDLEWCRWPSPPGAFLPTRPYCRPSLWRGNGQSSCSGEPTLVLHKYTPGLVSLEYCDQKNRKIAHNTSIFVNLSHVALMFVNSLYWCCVYESITSFVCEYITWTVFLNILCIAFVHPLNVWNYFRLHLNFCKTNICVLVFVNPIHIILFLLPRLHWHF